MVRLFIENTEIELTEDVQVAITSQFEDLSNPTNIINDWSKTISIPFSVKNNNTFGHIYSEDRLITEVIGNNYLSNSPSSIKRWTSSGDTYSNDSLSVNGEIVCDYETKYLQVGLQNATWDYVKTQNYNVSSGTIRTFEFVYDPDTQTRFEFSFRNSESDAPNGEPYFVQWYLPDFDLTPGQTYIVNFKFEEDTTDYIVYDFRLYKKIDIVGINFNPYKKLDFRLLLDSCVIMTGYAKMNDVKQTNGKGVYNITLFGQLGKVFQEMKKISFDESSTEENYLIDGSKYVEEYIDKDLVYSSWNSDGQEYSQLYPKYFTPTGYSSPIPHPAYSVTDIIGFAPNNSYNESFKYDTYQISSETSEKFTDTLGETFIENTGIDADTVIPNGMLPREIGEYRSYLQLPFIYWNKLWQIFQEKAEETTGYEFEMSSEWFNDRNPYWHDLVYMLKPFNVKDGTMIDDANVYTSNPYGSMGWRLENSSAGTPNTMTTHRTTNIVAYSGEYTETYPMIDSSVTTTDGKWFTLDDESLYPVFKLHTEWMIYDSGTSSSTSHLNDDNGLIIKFNAVGENGVTESVKYFVKHSTCQLTEDGANVFIWDGSTKSSDYETFALDANFIVNKQKFGDSVRFRVEAYWQNSNWCLTSNGTGVNLTPNEYGGQRHSSLKVTILDRVHRSFGYFTLNDLWNKDYNIFNEILNYCKIYRIAISIDEFEKKIKFMPYYTYFSDYTISDWTNKIDMSKDYIIKPVTFENKYVLFNYQDSKTKQSEEYKEKYGINYGEYRLNTDYNFNTETTNLFDKITQSTTNTDNVLSWTNIFDNHKIAYSFPAEIYVYNKDKDGKNVDVFGAFFFHKGKTAFSSEAALSMRPVVISDDTAFQQANNTYFYTQRASDTISTQYYPLLDVVYDDNLCLFSIPNENYTYLNNYSGKKSIYNNFWGTYLDERYNIQNKLITCYINLDITEYNQFEWNNFVKIGNQICIVNKIYDYDITSNASTKVDLVTVQDINAYKDDTFLTSIDQLWLNWSGVSYFDGEVMEERSSLGTFSSITDVTFSANGEKEYTINGIKFTIEGSTVYYQAIERYIDRDDLNFTLALQNRNYFAAFSCQRYSVHPYPYISITDSNDNTMVHLSPQSTYNLNWECTETEGADNHPTAIIDGISGSTPNIGSTWTVAEKMYQDGDDEYFRNVYTTWLTTGYYEGMFDVIMTDRQGWRETRRYYTTSDTIYVLNSSGTDVQSEDSVEYHGTSSTRGYKVYSAYSWTASLPQGVSAYGPTSGSAGTTSITINWGSGTIGTSKTITFTNDNGDTCDLVCHYVTE